MERAQQVLLQRLPQPQFRGYAAAEEVADVDAVGAFRGRGQSEQFDRPHVVEQPAVGRGFGVVELVDDDDVEVMRCYRGEPGCGSDWMLANTWRQLAAVRRPSTSSSPKVGSVRTS